MTTFEIRDDIETVEEKLDVAERGDDDYVSPNGGGCWWCNRDESVGTMRFDTEFDTFYHVECAEELGLGDAVRPVYKWEGRLHEDD